MIDIILSEIPASGHYWAVDLPPWWERAKLKKYDSKRLVKKKIKKIKGDEIYVWYNVGDEKGVLYDSLT